MHLRDRKEWLNHCFISSMNYDKSDIPNGGEQCKDRAYGIRKSSSDDCSAFARWRVTIEPRWLRPFSLSLSLSPSSFFTAIADDNSRQGCATRSAINTTERYPPLAAFSIRGWWFHVPTCCFSIPCYGNGEREEKTITHFLLLRF